MNRLILFKRWSLVLAAVLFGACAPTRPAAQPEETSPLPAPQVESGVEGRVELGSGCGNIAVEGEVDCETKPYQAQLTIVDQQGQVVVEETTAADGGFRFNLPPGPYRLEPETSDFLMVSPIEFQVEEGAFTYVNVRYDTNIQ